MAKKIIIELGDPQPLDCPKCKDKMGYRVVDYLKTHYDSFYNADGTSDGGMYSEYQPAINLGKRAYCNECLTSLPFTINR